MVFETKINQWYTLIVVDRVVNSIKILRVIINTIERLVIKTQNG